MSGWFGICTGNGAISNVTCGRCFEASTSTSGYITARRSWTGYAVKSNCSGGARCANRASVIGSTGAIWPAASGSNCRCHRGTRCTQRSKDVNSVNALWGAHCGKSARWVLSGGTGTRSQAHSVRALARKCQTTARLRNGLPLRGSSLPTRRIRRFRKGDKRRFGYSRDHRPDCVQILIALVVTPEGLPLAYEVLPGNTADKTTLRGFLDRIERQYGKARRIWLMDRGVPTEEVLSTGQARGL